MASRRVTGTDGERRLVTVSLLDQGVGRLDYSAGQRGSQNFSLGRGHAMRRSVAAAAPSSGSMMSDVRSSRCRSTSQNAL